MAFHEYDPAITEHKAQNVVVYQETLRICREGSYVAPSG